MKKSLQKLRKNAFWAIDFLKGGRVKYHYDDIKFTLENYSSIESSNKRVENLQNVLKHASETSPFYKDYRDFKTLSDFPVINKIVLRDKFLELQSEVFKNQVKYSKQTSGSSGTVSTTNQNLDKKRRHIADTIYFNDKAGYEMGARLYYIRKWITGINKIGKLSSLLKNVAMVNVSQFSDAYLANFIESLKKDKSRKAMLGYSSGYRDLCKYLDRINSEPIKVNLSCIITMSEALSDYTRKSLEKHFNVPVISRYSNMENGIFSMQLPNQGNNYHINWASYYIELLHPEKDIPVAYGELGRVVVTDLFNYCMPIIRYDTGDLAVMTDENQFANKAPVLTKIEGRKLDILYDTKGNPVSPYIVFHMESFSDLKQFQLIQDKENTYTLKLNTDKTFKAEQELIGIYKKYFGDDSIIKVEYVNEIPNLASGKRRSTVNNYRLQMEEESVQNLTN